MLGRNLPVDEGNPAPQTVCAKAQREDMAAVQGTGRGAVCWGPGRGDGSQVGQCLPNMFEFCLTGIRSSCK